MPLVQTRGAASAQGFGEFAQVTAVNYIEDVFSTYVYSGNDSTQTITNNIDISTKGALVWVKGRSGTYGTWDHTLINTPISNTTGYSSNTTGDGFGLGGSAFSPTTTGFNLNTASASLNNNGTNYVSWTFRKQPKFFDVVTYTGNGATTRAISHSLASTPGFVVIKETSSADNWHCWHRSFASFSTYILLNTTGGSTTAGGTTIFKGMSSTDFTIGSDSGVNANGSTYVAYLFAHNAGGFGLTGTDNVISCGSFTCDGSGNADVTLGYEPQWLLVKPYDASGYPWYMGDIMRGMPLTGDTRFLRANTSGAETGDGGVATFRPTATGFQVRSFSQANIYIAIRRGPMKVPTSGTSVFSPIASSASTGTALTTSFPVDMQISKFRDEAGVNPVVDRLRGVSTTSTEVALNINTNSTDAESTATTRSLEWGSTGFKMPSWLGGNSSIFYNFRRAPSFFDEVCYTGTGANRTVSHNLGAVPELMLVKARSTAGYSWCVYSATLGANYVSFLNLTSEFFSGAAQWNSTTPTSSVFSLSNNLAVNGSGTTFIAYLFATCAGVSKVGSYTGTGTTQTINCGFTGGARFVLIKRTDSTGDWYVWDTARGIVSGNDQYFLLNTTAAEVTNTDYIDTYSAGFEISSTAPAAINASAGTFIFLAIA